MQNYLGSGLAKGCPDTLEVENVTFKCLEALTHTGRNKQVCVGTRTKSVTHNYRVQV